MQLEDHDADAVLGEALSALFSRLGPQVRIEVAGREPGTWLPMQDGGTLGWGWFAPTTLRVTIDSADGAETQTDNEVTLRWPIRWSGGPPPPNRYASSPGAHRGLLLGSAFAASQGVRLRPGLHFLPRPVPGSGAGPTWAYDVLFTPDLGPDQAGGPKEVAKAILGGSSRRFVSDGLRQQVLTELGLAGADVRPGVLVKKLRSRVEELTEAARPDAANPAPAVLEVGDRRTSFTNNRRYGVQETFGELLFERAARQVQRHQRAAAKNASAATNKAAPKPVDHATVRRLLEMAEAAAVTMLVRGKSGLGAIVSRTGNGTTLARIEEDGRTSFVGFRGLGGIRGRADLRDLEPGWRHHLCPIQTPESTDTGLVRYQALAERTELRDACPNDNDWQEDWLDLSASAALIPFINHNDPARSSIGSKNLKQAIPVTGAEPPFIATGWESCFGVAYGTTRVPFDATGRWKVQDITDRMITLESRRGTLQIGYGVPTGTATGVDPTWLVLVQEGQRVRAGQVLAHAADVLLDPATGQAQLCQGVNALVALTPWKGLNHEDGIVVSSALAERFTSIHQHSVSVDLQEGDELPWTLVEPGKPHHERVRKGETIAVIKGADGEATAVHAPAAGVLIGSSLDHRRRLTFVVVAEHRLAVGDKLSNRHQGKGVVSAILDVSEMPTLPDGTPVEMILNPLGVLRRLNIGQFWEMHLSLAAALGADGSLHRSQIEPQRVGRRIAEDQIATIQQDLSARGAPDGRIPLTLPDGSRLGGDEGIVIGYQYMLKLDHLASAKLGVRGAEPNQVSSHGQPTQGKRVVGGHLVGSAQRMGEMEIWALQAAGADRVLADALQHRAAPVEWRRLEPDAVERRRHPARATLRSVQAHLAVFGLDLTDGEQLLDLQNMDRHDIKTLTVDRLVSDPETSRERLTELPGWRELGAETKTSDVPRNRDPLHGDDHGVPGSPTREQVQYVLPLPTPLPHPWDRTQMVHAVPVLPPAFRPYTPAGQRSGSDHLYQDLARNLLRLEQLTSPAPEPVEPTDTNTPTDGEAADVEAPGSEADEDKKTREIGELQRAVRRGMAKILGVRPNAKKKTAPHPDSVAMRLMGKRGLLRRYLLGQSVLFSGRSVIVPDLSIAGDQVGLPESMMKQLGMDAADSGDDIVLVNRQPSLHPYSIIALHAVSVQDDAIHLHPLVLTMLAGDFDGDTVAVHRPFTMEARQEAERTLGPARYLLSWAGGHLMAKSDLDISLGLCLGSGSEVGKALFAELDIPAPDTADDVPGTLTTLITQSLDRGEALRRVASLQNAALDWATGWSIGALDLTQEDGGPRLAEARNAGVAGKSSSVVQLLEHRGAVPGAHPLTPAQHVAGCFLTGLDSADYFLTAPGALAGLAGKKLTSPHAGALTKTLIEIADTVTVTEDDCSVVGDLRSPLTCTASSGVCPACYGTIPGLDVSPAPGTRVGLIAAMSIGERSTQLSMKSHHGGGQAGAVEDALGELKAIFGMGRSAHAFGVTTRGTRRNLKSYLTTVTADRDLRDPTVVLESMAPVLEHATNLLGGKVDAVHVSIILRRLIDTFLDTDLQKAAPEGHRGLQACAQRRGRSAFEVATARGGMRWLVDQAAATTPDNPSGLRTRLALGDPPVTKETSA